MSTFFEKKSLHSADYFGAAPLEIFSKNLLRQILQCGFPHRGFTKLHFSSDFNPLCIKELVFEKTLIENYLETFYCFFLQYLFGLIWKILTPNKQNIQKSEIIFPFFKDRLFAILLNLAGL